MNEKRIIKKKAAKKKVMKKKKKKVIKKKSEVPLEDKPLFMQERKEAETDEESLIEKMVLQEEDAGILVEKKSNSSIELTNIPKETIEENSPFPTHFNCGGGLQSFGSDGIGIWWECSECRSQFYNKNKKKVGQLGNPKDESVAYKTKNMPRRTRRLT